MWSMLYSRPLCYLKRCFQTYCPLHRQWHPAPGAADTGRASSPLVAPQRTPAGAETARKLPESERGWATWFEQRTMTKKTTGTAACWWAAARLRWIPVPRTPALRIVRWWPTRTGRCPWASPVWLRAPLGHWPVNEKDLTKVQNNADIWIYEGMHCHDMANKSQEAVWNCWRLYMLMNTSNTTIGSAIKEKAIEQRH